MPKIKGSQFEQLGQDTVAKAIAKAEGTTVKKAKEKLAKAKAEHMAKQKV